MKKLLLLAIISGGVIFFTYCSSAKKAAAKTSVSYASDVQPIISDKCAPCHIPEKGGKVAALNTYDKVKGEIGDIIRRIELNPGDRGFMPFKHPKLSDSTINVFKQWRDGGFAQ